MEKSRISRLSIISIWVGILIPILAALIPYGASWISPENALLYSVEGPISVENDDAIKVTVFNDGKELEENVVITIKRGPNYYDLINAKDKKRESQIIVDSDIPIKITEEKERYLLVAGNLRPEDKITISALIKDALIYSHSPDDSIQVKSDKHVAHLDEPSDFEEFAYPFGFWMFVILMVLILFAGIYQEYLMDPKKREKWLWDELDKLQKKTDA